jgi:hypothetical protein
VSRPAMWTNRYCSAAPSAALRMLRPGCDSSFRPGRKYTSDRHDCASLGRATRPVLVGGTR